MKTLLRRSTNMADILAGLILFGLGFFLLFCLIVNSIMKKIAKDTAHLRRQAYGSKE
jgi:hypothetical protein